MQKQTSFSVLFVFLLVCSNSLFAQGNYVLNLSVMNGQALTKQSLHNYTVINSGNAKQLTVKGSVKFRASKVVLNYQYRATLRSGVNNMQDLARSVNYTFSSNTLEQLFKKHGKLPNGEFEYCVDLFHSAGEATDALASDCIFDENEDLFLINLMEPEDKAKIDELFPMFSWNVNSPLINELNYKMRVAEIKDGQRANTAVMRNRPMYEQGGLRFPTQNYPVTARSLEYWQPYAWTVDAYYKDILMGSAETWEFVIVNDSLMQGIPSDITYLDIRKEDGGNKVYAIGNLKLKYDLNNYSADKLTLRLFLDSKKIKLPKKELTVVRGENRYKIDFSNKNRLKHLKFYRLEIDNSRGDKYEILFQYVNPEFVR